MKSILVLTTDWYVRPRNLGTVTFTCHRLPALYQVPVVTRVLIHDGLTLVV